jgi:hypothetical protein
MLNIINGLTNCENACCTTSKIKVVTSIFGGNHVWDSMKMRNAKCSENKIHDDFTNWRGKSLCVWFLYHLWYKKLFYQQLVRFWLLSSHHLPPLSFWIPLHSSCFTLNNQDGKHSQQLLQPLKPHSQIFLFMFLFIHMKSNYVCGGS